MEKERAIQCVPVELIERLKALGARLWEDRNPASVHINAILEEFEPDVKTLGNIITGYEHEYSGRLASNQDEYAQKESLFKKEAEEFKARIARLEREKAGVLEKVEEMKSAVTERETSLSEMKMKITEQEGVLNARYAARMQELYEKANKKELEMLARWEEKNGALEAKARELENAYDTRTKQAKLREKAMEEDLNAKKTELIKTFNRIKTEIDAREQTLENGYTAKMQQLKLREKAMEEDLKTAKDELVKTFDKIKAGLDEREKALAARERGGKL